MHQQILQDITGDMASILPDLLFGYDEDEKLDEKTHTKKAIERESMVMRIFMEAESKLQDMTDVEFQEQQFLRLAKYRDA